MTAADSSRAGWRKSSHSGANGSCIEVACLGSGAVAVRDSKNPGGPRLAMTTSQWKTFTESLKRPRLLGLQSLQASRLPSRPPPAPPAPSIGPKPAGWFPPCLCGSQQLFDHTAA